MYFYPNNRATVSPCLAFDVPCVCVSQFLMPSLSFLSLFFFVHPHFPPLSLCLSFSASFLLSGDLSSLLCTFVINLSSFFLAFICPSVSVYDYLSVLHSQIFSAILLLSITYTITLSHFISFHSFTTFFYPFHATSLRSVPTIRRLPDSVTYER